MMSLESNLLFAHNKTASTIVGNTSELNLKFIEFLSNMAFYPGLRINPSSGKFKGMINSVYMISIFDMPLHLILWICCSS